MAIRVLIERRVEPANKLRLGQLLVNLRSRAMQAEGYISGETLRSLEDPNDILVISTWNSVEEWQRWESSAERKALQAQIDSLLTEKSKTRIFVYPRWGDFCA